MKKEALYRSLTIAMPVGAFVSATGLSVFEWQRLRRFESQASATVAKLAEIDRELRSFEAQPKTARYPTVEKTPHEQAQFLDSLRANADYCNVELIRWSNSTPAPGNPPPTPPAGEKAAPALPAGVEPIVSTVEVSGNAPNMRQFLYNVVRTRRLLNMSSIKWVRDAWPNTHLTFTLTRYCAPEVALPGDRSHGIADAHAPQPTAASAPGPDLEPVSAQVPALGPPAAGQPGGMALPNPMDAPGIAHGTYQTRLEAGFSQLNEMNQSHAPDSPHPPAVQNTKR
jgi:hypothetical protein